MWVDIAEYENIYQISNYGQIKRFNRDKRYKSFKILKQNINSSGYFVIDLYKNNKRKTYTVHKLILTTFVGPCPFGMECRHLNGIRTDNRLCNLKWGTRSENVKDAIKHKTHKIPYNKGSKHGRAKLNDWKIRVIRRLLEDGYLTQKEIANIFEINEPAISKIQTNRTW